MTDDVHADVHARLNSPLKIDGDDVLPIKIGVQNLRGRRRLLFNTRQASRQTFKLAKYEVLIHIAFSRFAPAARAAQAP